MLRDVVRVQVGSSVGDVRHGGGCCGWWDTDGLSRWTVVQDIRVCIGVCDGCRMRGHVGEGRDLG